MNGIGFLVVLALLLVQLGILASIFSSQRPMVEKLLWFLVVFMVPCLGMLAWLLYFEDRPESR